MTRTMIIAALLAATVVTPAAAMDVATFLVKADAVKQKGVLAPLSPDYKPLMAELESGSKALRAERLAAQAAGARPAYCLTGKSSLGPDSIFDAFRAIPAAQRSQVQVKDALRTLYSQKYPCPT
jgi:hypothetical protein